MNEEKKKRTKIVGISIGILVVLLVVISSTYAYWQITKSQNGSNDIIAACLDIDMQSVDGTFALDPAWPISDTEGMQLDGYTFKVTNNCPEDVNYIIGMDSLVKTGVEYLNYDSVKLSVDNNDPVIYGSQENIEHIEENDLYQIRDSKKLYTAVVKGKVGDTPGSNTHNVKVWIKAESDLEDREKVFSGRMFITGGQKIDNDKSLVTPTAEACFEMDTETGTEIIGYDESCGESVVIPATVKGNPVKTIDTNAFKDEKIENKWQSFDSSSGFVDVENLDISNAAFSYVGVMNENPRFLIVRNNTNEIVQWLEEQADEMGTTDNPVEIYYYGVDEIPEINDGELEMFAEWLGVDRDPSIIGLRAINKTKNLSVKELDLSLATNLELIEEVAFSNWKVKESTKNGCVYNILDVDSINQENKVPTGLNNLKMGNQKELLLGTGAFGSLTMDELTIYTNIKAYSNCSNDDGLSLSVPFAKLNVNNLNISPIHENTSFGLNADGPFSLSSINNININEGIKEIGEDSFELVKIGSSINMPNTLEIIEARAFAFSAGPENLTVTIPDKVNYIGEKAFDYWKNTTTINFTRTEAEVKNQVTLGNNWNHNAQVIYAES